MVVVVEEEAAYGYWRGISPALVPARDSCSTAARRSGMQPGWGTSTSCACSCQPGLTRMSRTALVQ
jgi:hypothetical protein